MEHNSKNYRSHCPINFALEVLGDKWTLLIIRDLMFKGKQYYGEFLNSHEKISTNILADRLQRLGSNGVIIKELDPNNRSKWIYCLTEKGRDLLPIMLEITVWSGKYDSLSNTPKQFLDAYKDDRPGLMKRLKSTMGES